jgi:hypothetical protein
MAKDNFNTRDHEKLTIIQSIIEGKIANNYAAKQLNLSVRQIQRIKAEIKKNGSIAVIHKLKGRESNHHLDPFVKEKAVQIVRENYSDFKPTFAAEKLQENHHIFVNPQTLRRWMGKANIWKIKQKKQAIYFAWRPRKEYFGEMEQFDGSYHFWFENRYCDEEGYPIEVCLLASIDDATGEITKASFAQHEGVIPVFTFWKTYVEELGKPINIYLDKFSTYKINHKSAVDNHELLTQFQRASRDLNINLIPANSPQAKGRIERLFETLQDRLIKEMRLANINAPEEGNKFLKEIFVPKFNSKFSVAPAKNGNIHKVLSEIDRGNINHIFSVQSRRQINNDFTIQFKNNWHQLTELQPTTVRAKDKVIVEEWLDGTIHLSLREKYLNYTILPERPKKIKQLPLILTTHRLNWKPPLNHPWRQHHKIES